MDHWKKTVIKSSEIRWTRPRMKSTDDGKLDINISLPFTKLFHGQAKRSFGAGMMAMLEFQVSHQEKNMIIELKDLQEFLIKCGLPEIAERLK